MGVTINKTIKSGVRKMLFCMISKFEEKQQEKDAAFKQKQDCLRVVLDFIVMFGKCDEDSGRSSCSAGSIGMSPIVDIETDKHYNHVKRRCQTKIQEPINNTDLKVSVRPRSCVVLSSPDEQDPFPNYKVPTNQRHSVTKLFDSPRKGGLSNAHSSLDIASSTRLEHPMTSVTTLNKPKTEGNKLQVNVNNFRRGKPVQRAASRLYRADGIKGENKGCVGPEFIVRVSQPIRQINIAQLPLLERKNVTVILLNGQRVDVLCDPNTVTAGQIFEAVIKNEKYEHNFMLGVAYLSGGDFIFLPEEYKIRKVAPEIWSLKSPTRKGKVVGEDVSLTVFLRIKFFLPTNIANNIQGGEWRYRVYLQLRRATVEGQLTSTIQNLILLAGYALHIEFGEFSYREHGSGDYFLLEHYLPETSISSDMSDIKLRMKRAHESRRGLDKSKAIVNYITLAQTFRDYGAHFYSSTWATRDGFCRDVWLCIGLRGITIYSRSAQRDQSLLKDNNLNRIVLQHLPWHHIHTFYYNKKTLYIIPNSISGLSKAGTKYKLKMADNKSYFAFWLASLHHRLYLKLYAKEDFIKYLSDDINYSANEDNNPQRSSECSNYQDSYNLAVRNPIKMRRQVKKRFHGLFTDKTNAQNKENHKPNTQYLLKEILSSEQSEDSVGNLSTNSKNHENCSSNDGLSSSESCSLPRRHGVKMGTRVFNNIKSPLHDKYPKSSHYTSSDAFQNSDIDFNITHSDSDDLCSSTEQKLKHCKINSMKLLPERPYNKNLNNSQTAYVIESPKVYKDSFAYNLTSNDSCFNGSFFEKLDNMGGVQGERIFVTAILHRDSTSALGLQVAQGSDGNVYIKSITPGGPAESCDKLIPGDQIISVNGQTLLNIKYDKALELLQTAPEIVELIVLQNTNLSSNCKGAGSINVENRNTVNSLAKDVEDLEITDDELLNEEALRTIYALIKLTKDKVISRMRDKSHLNTPNKLLMQKCMSENKIYDESDVGVYSSQESTPQKKKEQFNTFRGQMQLKPKRRPLSLSIPVDVNLSEDYLTGDSLMKYSSIKSIQSSLKDLNKVEQNNVQRNVPLPRNFGLSRKWLGPVRYPVTPCKNGNIIIEQKSAIDSEVVKRHFVYGAGDEDQIFL